MTPAEYPADFDGRAFATCPECEFVIAASWFVDCRLVFECDLCGAFFTLDDLHGWGSP